MSNELVTLKNGSKELKSFVDTMVIALKHLLGNGENIPNVMAFYDLVMICRDPAYKISIENVAALQKRNLLNPVGVPFESIKNIVLSAVSGEGLEMAINSPYKEQ